MKPSIFIGSSSEALPLAKAIQRELSADYRAELWNEHLFELGEDTLNNLLRFIQCYDFAVLVLTGDDFTKSRGRESKSPRDNMIFELGLFMGALGRRRAFPIVAPGKIKDVKLPSDLLGNNAVFLPKGFAKQPTPAALRRALGQLLETLKARSEESSLQQLPSTALAIGYFQNFVLPVCKELANQQSVALRGEQIDISRGNFDFTIVLPATLSEASVEGAKKFCRVQKVDEFSLKTGARSYPFYVSGSPKAGRLVFYDYPTTLRASLEAVRLALAGPYLGYGKHHQILDEREIKNFERTLRILLNDTSATEFRDNVKIVQAG
jgi:hypothetical protein